MSRIVRLLAGGQPNLIVSPCRLYSHFRTMNLCVTKEIFKNQNLRQLVVVRYESSTPFQNSTILSYLSECAPTEALRSVTVSFHDYTGLPWWASIILMTTALRTCITFPLAIYQNYILAKVENLTKLDMPEIAEDVKREVAQKARVENWSERRASLQYKIEMKKKWNDLIVLHNCHPFKSTVTLWVQIPTWIFFSAALRNLAYMIPAEDIGAQIAFLQLSVGGFLWIPNLTVPDQLFVLPLLLGITNLTIVEMQTLKRYTDPTRFQRYVTNFFRFFCVALIPLSSTVPSVVVLYWTTSSVIGLLQNLMLMSTKLRSFCRIPDTPSTFEHPYRQLLADLKDRLPQLRR